MMRAESGAVKSRLYSRKTTHVQSFVSVRGETRSADPQSLDTNLIRLIPNDKSSVFENWRAFAITKPFVSRNYSFWWRERGDVFGNLQICLCPFRTDIPS